MIVVGGQAPKAIRSVECYDFEEERWDQIAELPSRRCRAGEQHHLSFRRLPFLACLCLVLKVTHCSCFPKHLCITDTLPFPTYPISTYTFWGQFLYT